jgi:hypothetical protein
LEREAQRNVELKTCEEANVTTYVPNSRTSPNRAQGKFDRGAFRYIAADDAYECPAGRRVTRWEHEAVVERAQARLARSPDAMHQRRVTAEHPCGTIKAWMGSTHFLTKTLPRVSTEMSLHVLAYNMKRISSFYTASARSGMSFVSSSGGTLYRVSALWSA